MKKKNRPASVAEIACPCGSGAVYARCCAPYHQAALAPTAEKLMRARYSAHVLRDNAFIAASWHPTTRPAELSHAATSDPDARWLGLEVRRHAESGDDATVEFVARYRLEGRARRLHEISRFVREGGLWWYLDGRFPEEEKR